MAAIRRRREQPPEPTFVFKGSVKKLGSATMKHVSAGRRTAVVRVDQVVEANPQLARLAGQEVTVELSGRAKVGDQMIFYTIPLMFGDSVSVRAVKQTTDGRARAKRRCRRSGGSKGLATAGPIRHRRRGGAGPAWDRHACPWNWGRSGRAIVRELTSRPSRQRTRPEMEGCYRRSRCHSQRPPRQTKHHGPLSGEYRRPLVPGAEIPSRSTRVLHAAKRIERTGAEGQARGRTGPHDGRARRTGTGVHGSAPGGLSTLHRGGRHAHDDAGARAEKKVKRHA